MHGSLLARDDALGKEGEKSKEHQQKKEKKRDSTSKKNKQKNKILRKRISTGRAGDCGAVHRSRDSKAALIERSFFFLSIR
jgi:hypothetical protein